MSKDPRHGVPSASGMYRLSHCLASFEMERGRPDTSSDDATSGTRIHKALETNDYTGLTSDEQETAEMCEAQKTSIIEAWNPCNHIIHHELRLGITACGAVVKVGDFPHKYLVTGQADVIAISGTAGMVIDYKTGRGEYDHAQANDQLRTLAVLAARHFRLTSVRVAIIQPWAGKPTVADYDAKALNASYQWLLGVLVSAEESTPKDRRAGDWCQWCKALDVCDVARNKALGPVEVMTQNLPAVPETARAALFARAMELPSDQLAGLVKGLRMVGWYANAIEGAAKLRAADDAEFQQYYKLKPGIIREKITDVQAVFQRMLELGVSAADFSAEVDLTKGSAESLVKKATALKGKALKAKLAEVLDGATEAKQTAPQLEEVVEEITE